MRLFLVIVLAGALGSCSSNEDCIQSPVCGEKVQSCCTPEQCHYSWKGRRFECNGLDCDAAADQVLEAVGAVCTPKGSSPDPLLTAAAEVAARRAAP